MELKVYLSDFPRQPILVILVGPVAVLPQVAVQRELCVTQFAFVQFLSVGLHVFTHLCGPRKTLVTLCALFQNRCVHHTLVLVEEVFSEISVMDKKVLLFEEQIIIYINIFSQKSEIYVT